MVRMDLPKIIPTTGFSCPFFFTGTGGRLAMAFSCRWRRASVWANTSAGASGMGGASTGFRRFRRKLFPVGFLDERLLRRLLGQGDVIADGRRPRRVPPALEWVRKPALEPAPEWAAPPVGAGAEWRPAGRRPGRCSAGWRNLVGRGGIGKGHLQVHRPAGLVDGGIPYDTALAPPPAPPRAVRTGRTSGVAECLVCLA